MDSRAGRCVKDHTLTCAPGARQLHNKEAQLERAASIVERVPKISENHS